MNGNAHPPRPTPATVGTLSPSPLPAVKPQSARSRSSLPSIASNRPPLPHARSSRKTWSPALASRQSTSRQRPALNPTNLSTLSISHGEFNTHAHVSSRDGRIHISVNALKDGDVSRRLMSSLNTNPDTRDALSSITEEQRAQNIEDIKIAPPKLNIVIMVIGSRGDVQPFIAIAEVLKERWGHRVRLATHGVFREFVKEHGIEFFDVGGDPGELMAFMVKNPGLVPGVGSIKAGDIGKRREQMFEMFQGFWRACIEPGDRHGEDTKCDEDSRGLGETDEEGWEKEPMENTIPFVADAIIANPPSFAHVHCAERLGIPLHLMFTFPYSPTAYIAHPLAFVQNSNLGSEVTNSLSYSVVETMTWQGLGDLINRFREKTLFLEPVARLWAPGMISRLKVPYTYMWSPALIPKPKDWDDHINITGFVFLNQAKDYDPPADLVEFIEAGPPPVYIGFGSIVVDDPDGLTDMIFKAVQEIGIRALVSKGWGGLGGEKDLPENVFMLGNIPHDWLFEKVEAVVHHGGAGTTAIGLYYGKPTMVVPFFGDQTFWGTMIHNANAGTEPVPHKELTVEKLIAGIRKLLQEDTRKAAQEISSKIRNEDGDGADNAVRSLYKSLEEIDKAGKRGLGFSGFVHGEGGPMGPGEAKWGHGGPGIRCDLIPGKAAVWRVRKTRVRLCAMAASWLIEKGKLDWKDLRLYRITEWSDFDGPGEPFSGGLSAFFSVFSGVTKGVIGVPKTVYKSAKRVDDEVNFFEELRPAITHHRFRRHFHLKRRHRSQPERPATPTSWTSTLNTTDSNSNLAPIAEDLAEGTSHSILKIVRSIAKAPMEISLAVAQGFHNAPRLYNDTVRRPVRITGFHSGCRAAGKEFVLGIYDGFTGLVLLPYKGVREEGVIGGVKGAGKGLAGVVLKSSAGVAGVVGFGLKGVHREIVRKRERKVLGGIIEARKRQGQKEIDVLVSEGEKDDLNRRMEEGWKMVQAERERGEREGGGLRRRRRERREKFVEDQPGACLVKREVVATGV